MSQHREKAVGCNWAKVVKSPNNCSSAARADPPRGPGTTSSSVQSPDKGFDRVDIRMPGTGTETETAQLSALALVDSNESLRCHHRPASQLSTTRWPIYAVTNGRKIARVPVLGRRQGRLHRTRTATKAPRTNLANPR
jgi:hypothetical protein